MTMLTISYKKHYIHITDTNEPEKVTIQLFDDPLNDYSTFKIYTVKSIQAAKLFITKHVKVNK